jgi:hypothetical protein
MKGSGFGSGLKPGFEMIVHVLLQLSTENRSYHVLYAFRTEPILLLRRENLTDSLFYVAPNKENSSHM